jgi:DNA polymerase-3 subunit delta'
MIMPWQEAVDAEFFERFQSDRMAHALMLSGPAGTGKLQLANRFLASVLCLEDIHPACGKCRSCQLLESGAHPDRQILTFEENPKTGELRKGLVIAQVRRLIASLQLTNTISKRKAALIHPVEAMNRHTANALLKTLEEPPGDTVMILLSHDPNQLPATIRSRCQNLHTRLPETSRALEWLCSTSGVSREEGGLALESAAGSPLRALQMLEDGSLEHYRVVSDTLNDLAAGICGPGNALVKFTDIDPDRLWSWLSLRAARETRQRAEQGQSSKFHSLLQSEADRNRNLVPTPVRKDLLLQSWLIQWAKQGR